MPYRAYAQKHESIGQNIGAGGIRYVVPNQIIHLSPPGFGAYVRHDVTGAARGRGCRGTLWIPRGTSR